MDTGLSTVCLSDGNAAYSPAYFKVKYRLHEDAHTHMYSSNTIAYIYPIMSIKI
jgi:hypothetical protein